MPIGFRGRKRNLRYAICRPAIEKRMSARDSGKKDQKGGGEGRKGEERRGKARSMGQVYAALHPGGWPAVEKKKRWWMSDGRGWGAQRLDGCGVEIRVAREQLKRGLETRRMGQRTD